LPIISISRYEIEHKVLPPVCIVTGEPTTHSLRHHFRWLPGWVTGVSLTTAFIYGLLRFSFAATGHDVPVFLLAFMVVPMIIVGAAVKDAKPVACDVPILRRKRNYWILRRAGELIGVMACLALIISGYTHSNELSGLKELPDYGLWTCRIGLAGFIVVGAAIHLVKRNSIHPIEISSTHVALANVHANFAAALEIERKLHAEREAERYDAYVAWQREKDKAEFAGWGSGHPRARRVSDPGNSDSLDDEQALLKSAEAELQSNPPEAEEAESAPGNQS
jgi:hypothetical protein